MKQTPSFKGKELPESEARNLIAIIERLERLAYGNTREGRNVFMENYSRLFTQGYGMKEYWKKYTDYLKGTGQEIGR